MQSVDVEIARRRALAGIESGLLRLKWLRAATRFELAMRRHDRALKAGFNPDQPRVPAGVPEGGQWTDDGGGTGERRIRVAGELPTGDSPKIPKEPPRSTRERNIVLRSLARRLGPYVWVAAEAGSWIYDHKEEINAYFDAPKSLEELQEAANSPQKGYDIHHIVERNSAAQDGSEADLIERPENLVRVPRWKHWEINSFYERPNKDYGWQTPRQYLKEKSWEERTRVGLDALRDAKVLRP